MLNTEHAVVAHGFEGGYHFTPVLRAVAIPNRAKYPRTRLYFAIVLGVEHAVFGGVIGVNSRVFGMEMINGAFELFNGGYRIHALPDQVAGIEVGAQFGGPRRF